MDWGPVFAMAADRPASFSVHCHSSPSGLPDWLGAFARKYEHKISFIVKINHKAWAFLRPSAVWPRATVFPHMVAPVWATLATGGCP